MRVNRAQPLQTVTTLSVLIRSDVMTLDHSDRRPARSSDANVDAPPSRRHDPDNIPLDRFIRSGTMPMAATE